MIIVIAHHRILVGRYSAPLLSKLRPTKSCGFSPYGLGPLLPGPLGHYPHLSRRVLGHAATYTTCLCRCLRRLPEVSLPKFRVTDADSAPGGGAYLPNVRKHEPADLCGWR